MRESTSTGGATALIKIDVCFESIQEGPTRRKRLPAALVIGRELAKCLLQLRRNNSAFSCQVCTVITNITPTATRFALRKWVHTGSAEVKKMMVFDG